MSDDSPTKVGCGTVFIGVILFTFAVVLALIGRAGCGPCALPRKASGQVVDETGRPVPDAEIKLKWTEGSGFSHHTAPDPETIVNLQSDANGHFSGRAGPSYFGIHVEKTGYYSSSIDVPLESPSDSLTILLNKIRHSQPMIGKRANLHIPIGASQLQYDFLLGDCLPPLGKGVVADLEIQWTRPEERGAQAAHEAFKTRMVGAGDGLIPPASTPESSGAISRLRSKHEAPTEGYEPSCDFGNHFRGGNLVAYIKIRTGQPGGPLFGKMLDPISYSPERDCDRFEFEYVVNPSGDRGLEMDMKNITVPTRHELEYAPDEF